MYGIIQKLNLDPINWEKGAGLGATVGNPNFFGALLGILSIIPLFYFFNPKIKYKYLHLLIYVLIFITPAISSLFMQVDKSYKPIIYKGHEYYKSFHPKLFKHSNINSWISKSYNIGEVRIHREYGNSFAFIFMNKIIWETSDYGTIFNSDNNNFYLKQ